MKVLVRFENDYGEVSLVGMNNLFIIKDGRIKTLSGIARRVHDLLDYHPDKLNKYYRVYKFDTAEFLFKGRNWIIYSYQNK
jgi:hypothetical protein